MACGVAIWQYSEMTVGHLARTDERGLCACDNNGATMRPESAFPSVVRIDSQLLHHLFIALNRSLGLPGAWATFLFAVFGRNFWASKVNDGWAHTPTFVFCNNYALIIVLRRLGAKISSY